MFLQAQARRFGRMVIRIATRGISLPRELDQRLVKQAQAEDRPVSTVVKRSLLRYLAEAEVQQLETGGGQQEE